MRRQVCTRVVLLLMVIMAGSLLGRQTEAAAASNNVSRTLEPVVLAGTQLPDFLNAPVDDLFVYVYRNGVWSPVPFQVDEVRFDGEFTASGDGLFNEAEELVFMARDLGEQAIDGAPLDQAQPFGTSWYEVEVTNPLNPVEKGWAYIVRSDTVTPTFLDDYVGFDDAAKRITSDTYQFGLEASGRVFDYLALGQGLDILDRTPKLRGCKDSTCLTENFLNLLGSFQLVKDGPVRLIMRSSGTGVANEVLAYDAIVAWVSDVRAPITPTTLRLSTDFNENAIGSTYYNAAVPDGVLVDGVPDNVPATPFSPWWQVSTNTGTVVQASDISPAGGTPTNYYVDDAQPCSTTGCDTGDLKHYGDTGTSVANPRIDFTYVFKLYFLSGPQPKVGGTYQTYFEQPLSTLTKLASKPVRPVYLPVVF